MSEEKRKKFDRKKILEKGLIIIPKYYNYKRNEKIVYYRDIVIKGYTGVYILRGEIEMLQLILNTGLGSKNSLGFGMVQLFNNQKGFLLI